MSDSRWRGWLIAVAIFVLGVGVGGAGMAWAGIRVFRHITQKPDAPRGGLADRAAEYIGKNLTKQLELTSEQSAQVQAILDQSALNIKATRTKAAAEVTRELRETVRRIAAVLPGEKRAEFNRVINHRFKRLGDTAPTVEENGPEKN
jgi:Spy/CpxP family protein refolding chaperone